MEIELDRGELAASAFRVFRTVMGEKSNWDGASLDVQAPWIVVAAAADRVLGELDGKPYAQAAYEIMRHYLPQDERKDALIIWNSMQPRPRLAWEAVARHLTMLLNSDEIRSVEEAEAIWPQWAAERLPQQKAVQQ